MPYSYKEIAEILKKSGIDDHDFEAREILMLACGVSHAAVMADPCRVYDSPRLDELVKKRAGRYPIQYMRGEVGFHRGSFKVTEDTLIPREDTELLVETALRFAERGYKYLDLCTGSGCVAISVLMSSKGTSALATDISDKAIAVAAENARYNSVSDRVTFMTADVFEPSRVAEFAPFDMIISNPPYIPSLVVDGLEPELRVEPRIALDGGEDGLDFYRFIVKEYKRYLSDGGRFAFEIGYDQGKAIERIAEENGYDCEIYKDYGENDRVALLTPKAL